MVSLLKFYHSSFTGGILRNGKNLFVTQQVDASPIGAFDVELGSRVEQLNVAVATFNGVCDWIPANYEEVEGVYPPNAPMVLKNPDYRLPEKNEFHIFSEV